MATFVQPLKMLLKHQSYWMTSFSKHAKKTLEILGKSLSSTSGINYLRHFHFPALLPATFQKLF